jgi:Zn-dependent protease
MSADSHDPRTAPEPITAPEPATLPDDHDRGRMSLLARLLAPLAVLAGVIIKFGAFSIKFFGIFISVGAYALIWGWQFGVGFVALILVHELGHYLEARRQGLDAALPVFIPFVGAYVLLRNAPFDPWRNVLVSIAGPIAGGAAAAALLVVGEAQDNRLLLALAYSGFFLNLINLIPVWILDGGQIYRSWRVLHRGAGRANPEEAKRLAWIVVVLAVGTAVLLVAGMIASHVPQTRL